MGAHLRQSSPLFYIPFLGRINKKIKTYGYVCVRDCGTFSGMDGDVLSFASSDEICQSTCRELS